MAEARGAGSAWLKAVNRGNASIHTSRVIRRARHRLSTLGIDLYFLPSYGPEQNRVEPVFRQVKHQEMPQRSFTSRGELRAAVDLEFSGYSHELRSKRPKEPRPIA